MSNILMVRVEKDYNPSTNKFIYKVYKNNEFQKYFFWKWCAIRFAKRLKKELTPTSIVFLDNYYNE